MPQPGFYNDNEYRAYPFVYKPGEAPTSLPNNLIVDAGVVMGLDADFDATTHSIWLTSIRKTADNLELVFATDAPAAASALLTFTVPANTTTWTTVFAASAPVDITVSACATEPIWEGFIVTGFAANFAETLAANQLITFTKNQQQLEPGRIQNLAKSYLRSISVGNFRRTRVPGCNETNNLDRVVMSNQRCLAGDLRLKAGYHCTITQTDFVNQITVGADATAGLQFTGELCAHGSELPLFRDEQLPADSKFFGGGPACNELISTINGLHGPAINIVGGPGVQINTTGGKISVALNANSQNACKQV
ncbi:hypothetical protein EBZ39_02790 [bacterium]|nr:hypothetical protein [bacterium]